MLSGEDMLQRLLATFGRIEGVQAAAVVDVDMNEIATFLTPDLKDVDVSNGLQKNQSPQDTVHNGTLGGPG